MFKFLRSRKRREIDNNSARIEAVHSELKQMLSDPTLDPKAPMPMTPEFKALQEEFLALVERNLELLHPSPKK